MPFSPEERRFLQHLGRIEPGKELIALLQRMKTHYSSIDGITGGDYGAQIEGRKLMSKMIDEISECMHSKERALRPRGVDDFS